MRIGLDLSCLIPQPLTGVGYYTLNLFEAYQQRFPETTFSVGALSAQPASDCLHGLANKMGGLHYWRVPTRLKQWCWTKIEWPPFEWLSGAVDIVHGGFHLLPPSRKAPRMITVFDLTNLRQRATHSRESVNAHEIALRHAARRADRLIAISESTRQDAIELLGADPEKVKVVYGGVKREEFDRSFDDEAHRAVCRAFKLDGPYWIHLGTLEPRKNLVRLIEAYANLKARKAALPKLVLAGGKGWFYEAIFERIAALGLEEDVIHTGYLSREDAVLLLRGATACVYPSLYEGFGLPVLEAMAAQVPVLTSNVSSLPEVIGDTGILVEPESVASIEAGLEALLNDYEGALARIPAARQRAETFSWNASAEALHHIYQELAS